MPRKTWKHCERTNACVHIGACISIRIKNINRKNMDDWGRDPDLVFMIDSPINKDKTMAGGDDGMKGWILMGRHIVCGVGALRRCYDK